MFASFLCSFASFVLLDVPAESDPSFQRQASRCHLKDKARKEIMEIKAL